MSSNDKIGSRDQLRLSIANQADHIEKNMKAFSILFDEFCLDWLKGVDANYKEFLNYLLCSIKKFEESKKSS